MDGSGSPKDKIKRKDPSIRQEPHPYKAKGAAPNFNFRSKKAKDVPPAWQVYSVKGADAVIQSAEFQGVPPAQILLF
jgi:hypothetical protein